MIFYFKNWYFPLIICLLISNYHWSQTTITPNTDNILYVNSAVSGGNESGDSWTNAIPELADALQWARNEHDTNTNWLANDSLQIYVAKGTYKPLYNAADTQYTTDGARENSFVMVENVQLYGGFDPDNNISDLTDNRILPFYNSSPGTGSILSGDIGITGDSSDNVYHVVISSGNIGNGLINGFEITEGNATGGNSTTVVNTETLNNNSGGGMYNYTSSPQITQIKLENNTAQSSGGGIYNNDSSILFTEIEFSNNSAQRGGGVYSWESSPIYQKVRFINNNSSSTGGGMYCRSGFTTVNQAEFYNNSSGSGGAYAIYFGSGITFTNATIVNNTPDAGYSFGSSVTNTYYNSIVYDGIDLDSSTLEYYNSLFEGNTNTNDGNLDTTGITLADIFNDPTNNDFSLEDYSPVINVGDNQAYTNAGGDIQNDTDILNNPRLSGGTIDLGAYEAQNSAPTVICQDITVSLDANGEVTITPQQIDNGSTDAEGTITFSLDVTEFDCNNIGTPQTVTLTGTDTQGLTDSCAANVTIQDNLAPTATCVSPFSVSLDTNGNANITTSDIDDNSTDNCNISSIDIDNSNFDCSMLGNQNVTLTVIDDSGNSNTCTTTVTVLDDIIPEVICQDITVTLDISGNATILPSDIDNGSFDNCNINSYSLDTDSFDCSMLGANTVNLTVTDDSGNSNTCSATVTVEDSGLSNLTCTDFTVSLDENGEASILPEDLLSSGNNCTTTLSVDIDSFDCNDLANPVQVTVTAQDNGGNTETCTSTVTVIDSMAPQLNCLSDQTFTAEEGESTYTVPDFVANGEVTALDNCGGQITFTQDPMAGTTLNAGDYDFTFTAEDQYGNTTTCIAAITVSPNMSISTNTMESLKLYPNPAESFIAIDNPNSIQLDKLIIYDLNGKIIKEINKKSLQSLENINVQDLESARYFVKIISNNNQVTVKTLLKK